jgi:5-methylcytosine-specific restriction endonuclease McrA
MQRTPEYLARINSPEWQVLKARLIRERGRRCERCGFARRRLDLHHRQSDRLGREEDYDLQLLCRECHKIADRQRVADTAYNNGLETYTRKKYGEYADPSRYEAEFDQWREEKNRGGY